ncbi:MAG: PilN domain-containing protein [Candidatus Dojkabacteria bacterium]
MSLHGFNLLQGSIRPEDTWDRVNAWVNTAGRFIIIIVEMIVIGSFVARVVIDTQTKNLLEQEETNTQALAALRTQELDFRDQQERFETFRVFWDQGSTLAEVAAEVDSLRPRNIEELSISIRGELIDVGGEAATREIGDFENELKNSEFFSDVQVSEIEQLDEERGASSRSSSFNIRITLGEGVIQGRDQFNQVAQDPQTQNNQQVQPVQ